MLELNSIDYSQIPRSDVVAQAVERVIDPKIKLSAEHTPISADWEEQYVSAVKEAPGPTANEIRALFREELDKANGSGNTERRDIYNLFLTKLESDVRQS